MRRLAALVTGWPRAVVAASVVLAILGAWLGVEGIPVHLGAGALAAWDRAHALLDRMPLVKQRAGAEYGSAAAEEL
jgi:hypothetical protein